MHSLPEPTTHASATQHQPLRLLHVISSVDPAYGGPIEGLKQVSAVHVQQGHHVEVLSLDAPDSPWLGSMPLPTTAIGPGRSSFRYTPALVPWLQANAGRFDAVIVHGLWQHGGFATWKALRGSSTPYFAFTHGMLDPWFKRHYPGKHLKKWLYWPWGQYPVLRDARAVLFTCEEEKLLARQSFWLYRCNEQVVKFGTLGPGRLAPAQVLAARDEFFARFPAARGKRCLLFLGRVHEKKGTDLLLHAFKGCLEQAHTSSQPHLVMAGPAEHPYGQAMQALAASLGLQQHITWTGMLTGDAKWSAFHAADAFVLPSHQENFGIAVAEALACGVPVLLSDQVNIWREVLASGAGFVAPDTLAGTQQLLQQWLETPPAEWEAMRQRAKDCFAEKFHIEQAAASLIDTLRSCGVGQTHDR